LIDAAPVGYEQRLTTAINRGQIVKKKYMEWSLNQLIFAPQFSSVPLGNDKDCHYDDNYVRP